MSWLIPYFILNMALIPTYNFKVDDSNFCRLDNQFETEIIIGAELFDFISIEGEILTYMNPKKITKYQPYQEEYSIRVFATYGPLTIGAEHTCYHPVISEFDGFQYKGGIEKIYIEFNSRYKCTP